MQQSNVVCTKHAIFCQATREKNYIVRFSMNEKEAYLKVLFQQMSGGAEKKHEETRSW
jgi:hypothetical protein